MRHAPCALVALVAAAAHAVEPAQLLDRELNSLPIQFISLSTDRLKYFDAKRQLQETSLRQYVSLRFERQPMDPAALAPRDSAEAQYPLSLSDGHVISGQFAGVDEQGRVKWKTDSFGTIAFALDRIRQFAKPAPVDPRKAAADPQGETLAPIAALEPPAPLDPSADQAELANGDRLAGFVEKIDAKNLTLQVNGQSLALGWERVARVTLANPIKPAPGIWVNLEDNSRIRVDDIVMDGQRLTGKALEGRSVELATAMVISIDLTLRQRLVRLGDLEWSAVTEAGAAYRSVFGVNIPPQLTGDQARLHAPLTLRFELPAGAKRFAAAADLEEGSTDWGDLVLKISDGKGELFNQRLNGASPGAKINLALRDRRLLIHLDEGVNGPIRDRLILSRAVILVEGTK